MSTIHPVVTGSRELAAAGAQVLAPRASRLGFGHRGLEDGEEVDLGGLVLRALPTPGHAPEHVSYLLVDDGRPPWPAASGPGPPAPSCSGSAPPWST
jgi:glyoxylase-like metal-dependent hydrolase (beta-lactamase superfamily II)